MKWVIGWSILLSIFWIFFAEMTITNDVVTDIDKHVSYVWAWYMAESSIQKELLALKTEDINSIDQMNIRSSLWTKKDMEYGFINAWADAWYFDLEVKNTPTADIDLGNTVWWDILFEWLKNEDYFDTFILNYNKSTASDLLVEVIRSNKNWSFTRCDFYDNVDGNCTYLDKQVINTSDSNLNWTILNWLQIYFNSWTDGFNNKLTIQWFNANNYNYRITFSTLRGDSINFAYHVESWGISKSVVNNFIEIDTVWTAIDNFARIKLEKRITNNTQPNTKYVLFSNWEIAK